jgi:hypothetical protein
MPLFSKVLNFFDEITEWLDFSWLIVIPDKQSPYEKYIEELDLTTI